MARRELLSVTVLVLLLALPAFAGLAGSHALPTGSVPPSGAVLSAAPREVRITFSERLEPGPSSIEVRASNGTLVSQPSAVLPDRSTMSAPLPQLDYGTYTVAWRTTSAEDGHSTRGIFSFLYHDPSKPLTASDLPPESQTQALVSPVDPVLRALQYSGLLIVLGSAALALAVSPSGTPRRLAKLAAGAAVLGAGAAVLLAASSELTAAGGGSIRWFGDRFAQLALARAVLLLLAGACAGLTLRMAGRARTLWALGALLGLGAVVATSWASHAAALASLGPLAIGLDALHLAASAAWVGGIIGLGWVLWRGAEDDPGWSTLALRYSALALVASLVVVGTGVAQGLLELKSLAALTGSAYGQVLLVKVALVAGLLAFGGRNRFQLIPALQRGASRAWHRLGASLRQEAVLGIAVICVAGLLTSLSPPLPPSGPAPPPVVEYSQVKDGENLTLLLSPNPVRVGEVTVDLFLYTRDGLSDGNATNVTLTLRPPDVTLGNSQVKLGHPHPGHFATEGPLFAMPGNWTLRFDVQRQGAFDVVADFVVPVAPAS